MKRISILLVLLMALATACASNEASPSATVAPDPTAEPTVAPTESAEPTAEASGSDGSGGSGSLDDLIPDELNGIAGTPIPGMDQILSGALQAQGLDAGEAEFAFVTYGTGTDAVVLNAFRIPGVTEVAMQQLGQIMSGAGAGQEVDVETLDIGGKTVLSFSGEATPGVVYFYVADDVAFTIAGQDAGLAEQLLSELP